MRRGCVRTLYECITFIFHREESAIAISKKRRLLQRGRQDTESTSDALKIGILLLSKRGDNALSATDQLCKTERRTSGVCGAGLNGTVASKQEIVGKFHGANRQVGRMMT